MSEFCVDGALQKCKLIAWVAKSHSEHAVNGVFHQRVRVLAVQGQVDVMALLGYVLAKYKNKTSLAVWGLEMCVS